MKTEGLGGHKSRGYDEMAGPTRIDGRMLEAAEEKLAIQNAASVPVKFNSAHPQPSDIGHDSDLDLLYAAPPIDSSPAESLW